MKKSLICLAALLLLCSGLLTGLADGKPALPEKVVYLTFDDGPKKATPDLLAILDELDVPATFFLLGLQVRAFPEYTRMIYERGDTIACHTMDHSSNDIKEDPSMLALVFRRFLKEMYVALNDPLFTTDLFRFPGGSSSYPYRTKKAVTDLGWSWFDWNAMTRDTYDGMDAPRILHSVITMTKEQPVVILLAHDGKGYTRQALPDIVAFYRQNGYEFRRLSSSMEERRILARCPAHMHLPDNGAVGRSLLETCRALQ
ncbi:MAG: polysaccharide deacetylase family protein [Clostridia bacterium]|nr:polysaccharide deacetylase family protein [Clostridia bacterium]